MTLDEQIAQTVDPTLFTRLCNTLFAAEYGHNFQPIDGTRGDEGNDGWVSSEKRMLAIYCPLKPERRTDKDYRDKAIEDLEKANELRALKRLPVERWTFVTPRKLANDVIVTITKRAAELGITANHIEATHLSVLFLKHDHLLKEFPEYHVSQLEELLKAALQAAPSPQESTARAQPEDNFHNFPWDNALASDDESLKEVLRLRESDDRQGAKSSLRALCYRSTDPYVQINAVLGLLERFDPSEDDPRDLAVLCDVALATAIRANSKSAEAYLHAQKGYLLSFAFGMNDLKRHANLMMESATGLSLTDPRETAALQADLAQLGKAYRDSFRRAIELSKESGSAQTLAAVLIQIGNAAGHRVIYLRQVGSAQAANLEREVCKKSLLGAKELYVAINDDHGVANALMNLANQLRFLGEQEEAKELVKVVIPVAEKYGDSDLLKKAKWLEDTLATGRIPDYAAGERRE